MEKAKSEFNKITIIGKGHIGQAIAKELLNSGFNKNHLLFSNSSKTNRKTVLKADWIILAVKPAIIPQVICEIKEVVENKIFISVAATTKISSFKKLFWPKKIKIVRIMPSITISNNNGVIGIFSDSISKSEKDKLINLFSSLGLIVPLKNENDIDMLTIISSCGPAIVAYFVKLMIDYGKTFQLSNKTRTQLVLETFNSTLIYLKSNHISPDELIHSVSTKGGITESIFKSFSKNQINSLFYKAFHIGYQKILRLNKKSKL